MQTLYGLVVEHRRAARDALRAVSVPALRWRQEVGLRSEILSWQFRSNAAFHSIQYWVCEKLPRIANRHSSPATGERAASRFESAKLRSNGNRLPTRTPIAEFVAKYVNHIRTRKTAESTQTDVYYFPEAFRRSATSCTSPADASGKRRIRTKTIAGRRWQPKTGRNRAAPISSTLRRRIDARGRRLVPGRVAVLVAGGQLVGPGQLQS
ncbi:MAG TPA: hypothetical protein VF624_07180 [Tepidisphaeraceae bacterium]